jgi:hypothetical protein
MGSLRLEHGLFSLGMPISHETILKSNRPPLSGQKTQAGAWRASCRKFEVAGWSLPLCSRGPQAYIYTVMNADATYRPKPKAIAA